MGVPIRGVCAGGGMSEKGQRSWGQCMRESSLVQLGLRGKWKKKGHSSKTEDRVVRVLLCMRSFAIYGQMQNGISVVLQCFASSCFRLT